MVNNELITKLTKWLIFLTSNSGCVSFLKSSNEFKVVVKKEILILLKLTDCIKEMKNKDTELVIKNFNSIFPNELKTYEDLETKNMTDDEIIDFINYLKIYVKNILHIDLNDNLKPTDKLLVNPQINQQQFSNAPNVYQQNFAFPNPILVKKVHENLKRKIQNDEILIYNSYPTLFHRLRIIYGFFIIFFSLIMFGLAITDIFLQNKTTILGNRFNNLIFTAIFNFLASALFAYIFSIVMKPWYTYIKSRILSKSETNQLNGVSKNEKNNLPNFYIIFVIILVGCYAYNNFFPASTSGNDGLGWVFDYAEKASENAKQICLVLQWMTLTMLIIGGILLIMSIILYRLKPTENKDLISKLAMDEFSNNQTKQSDLVN